MGLAGVYDATALYDWNSAYSYDGGAGRDGQTSATAINFRGTDTTLSANSAYNGTFKLFDPGNTAFYKYMTGQVVWDYAVVASLWLENWGGRYRNVAAVDSLRLVPSAGTLTGTIRIYGVSKQEGVGAGSPSSTFSVPDYEAPQATANDFDRDFNDADDLTGLTLLNTGSGVTYDVGVSVPGAFSMMIDASAGTSGKGFLQSIPAGDCVVEYRISAASEGTNYPFVGMPLAAGLTGASSARQLCLFREGDRWVVYIEGGTAQTPSGIIAGPLNFGWSTGHGIDIVLRAERVGTTWTFSWRYPNTQVNSNQSHVVTEATLGFTVAATGIVATSSTVAKKLGVSIHSARYNATPTTMFGGLRGSSSGSVVSLPLRASALPYTTNLAFHHRPDIGITMDASNRVANWSDPAFPAKDVAQATAINQPIWDPTALNGRPGLRFKRNQWLSRTTSAAIASTDNYTFFVVLKPAQGSDTFGKFVFMNGGAANGIGLTVGQESVGASWNRVVTIVQAVAWQQTTDGYWDLSGESKIICIQRAAGTTTIYSDHGVLAPTYATVPIMPTEHWYGWDGFVAGPLRNYDGVLGDVIGFNASLAAADRESIMRYLGAYYGIPTYA
jgi:hypothetical protein